MTNDEAPEVPALIACRATVNLADAHNRVPAGTVILVNPDIPYISERLKAGYLVPLPHAEQPQHADGN